MKKKFNRFLFSTFEDLRKIDLGGSAGMSLLSSFFSSFLIAEAINLT